MTDLSECAVSKRNIAGQNVIRGHQHKNDLIRKFSVRNILHEKYLRITVAVTRRKFYIQSSGAT